MITIDTKKLTALIETELRARHDGRQTAPLHKEGQGMTPADQIRSLEAEVRRLSAIVDRNDLERADFVAHIARLQQDKIREESGNGAR